MCPKVFIIPSNFSLQGDSYSVTFNRKIDNVDAYFDIASFNITQSVSKGSPYEQSVNNKTTPVAYQFILNRTKDDSEIFNVTKVVPVHKVDGHSMRPLYTSENSQFPLYNYSTQLLLHDTNEKIVAFHLVHRITLHASYARCNGGNLDKEGKHLHITLRFLNPIHFAAPRKMVGDSADVEMPPEAHLRRYHSRNHTDSDDSEFEPPLDSLEIARVDLEPDE